MSEFFDTYEIQPPEVREAALLAELPRQIAHAQEKTPYFRELLKNVQAADITGREALAQLPVTYKSDLIEAQAANRPFGGMNALPPGDMLHLFLSPGPIAEPEGRSHDWWRGARSLFAAGFRKGDTLINTFSYHFTPAGLLTDSAARALGCAVFPGGVGQTDRQVEAIHWYGINGFMGTPDFLKIIMDKADELGVDISSMTKALVGAGALPPSLRQEIIGRGVSCVQNYGTADLGIVAYESQAMEGMILSEGMIVEIVRPGTGEPVAEGEVGEVVVTQIWNKDYPLIRFATGDLSAMLPGVSPCGRTAPRIKGWMGRADQSTKVRGMFVRPNQVANVVKQHPQVQRARIVIGNVDRRDTMVFKAEVESRPEGLADAIAKTIDAEIRIRAEVELVAVGSLPNDGKVIEDTRTYE
ncbi:MAG: AMP-binding protein [Alphaproteobacteria bacterium]|nr:AMP-binding protein [Alphaproteobacteria bacterium]MCB9930534.1 AMP-binding protein [Alphaproteobacteria bacterium]